MLSHFWRLDVQIQGFVFLRAAMPLSLACMTIFLFIWHFPIYLSLCVQISLFYYKNHIELESILISSLKPFIPIKTLSPNIVTI